MACGESPLGYTNRVNALVCIRLWLVGNRRSDTLFLGIHERLPLLWLVGNRRSDTLPRNPRRSSERLWLVGNRRSDTLTGCCLSHTNSCGLWGIAARIHSCKLAMELDASCGLWGIAARIHSSRAWSSSDFGCGLWGIAARIHSCRKAWRCSRAVACGESPLGYTKVIASSNCRRLWLVGNRRSDTLKPQLYRGLIPLWLVGNRRSDTLPSR